MLLACLALGYGTVQLGYAASLGLSLKYSYLLPPVLIAGIHAAVSRVRDPRGGFVLLVLGMLTASFVLLVGVWQSGVSDGLMVGGLLPYSDAAGYYTDALRLLHGQRFSVFSSRRPLFAALLAGLLNLTDGDLRAALVILTSLTVVAICLAAREVQRTFGLGAGILMLSCLFMFYRRYIGSTLTEHLGLTFGCLAFGLIWRGTVIRRRGPVLFGLLLLSLGLNARAGAFLVLPAVLLWAVWTFRDPVQTRWRMAAGGVVAILLGFAVTGALLYAAGIPGAAYSNFSYALYGLVVGGNWSVALQQHPELSTLPPLEQAHRVYALAWDQIRAHPLSLPLGCLRAWRAFFLGRSGTWFSHILYLSPGWSDFRDMLLAEGVKAVNLRRDCWVLLDTAVREVWIVTLNGLMLAGVWVLRKAWQRPLALLTIAAWIGILLSVPFAPPWDADNMRAYAATLPFVILLPVTGLAFRRAGWRKEESEGGSSRSPRPLGLLAFSLLLVALQILGPVAVMAGRSPRWMNGGAPPCAAGCQTPGRIALVYLDPRLSVHMVGSAEEARAIPVGDTLSLRDLRARIHMKDYPDTWHMWRTISQMPAGTTLALAFDPRRGDAVYVQAASGTFPRSPGLFVLCGDVLRQGWIEWFKADAVVPCGPREGASW